MENSVAVKMNEDALYILIWKVFQDKNLSVKSKIKAEYIACYNLCLKNGELEKKKKKKWRVGLPWRHSG